MVECGHYLLIETAGLDGGDQIAFDSLSNSADLPESMNWDAISIEVSCTPGSCYELAGCQFSGNPENLMK